tara:strand:+ start:497 stop:1738 length:1242 start_codon:yes stop_codon:yes gene_type:complete
MCFFHIYFALFRHDFDQICTILAKNPFIYIMFCVKIIRYTEKLTILILMGSEMIKYFSMAMAMFVAITSNAVAGGADHSGHSMAAGKAGSGVHFYGRLYVGYDQQATGAANSVDNIRDNGQKSRLGIKFKENLGALTLIGNAEWKFDIADGWSTNDSTNCSTDANGASPCQSIELHVGNLGFMTPLGYIGMGSYETPYKTMGLYDHNMDTAIGMNEHGATSSTIFGQAGTWDSSLSYHGKVGPLEVAYMRAMSEATNNTNVDKNDYALGLRVENVMLSGLELGVARTFDKSEGHDGQSNDKIFASYKVMPGLGVFYTQEDLEIASSGNGFTNGEGDIDTYGIHYTMGNNDIQIVHATGDSREVAANEDYHTFGISNKMNLSRSTDVTFGYIRKGMQGSGSSVRTYGVGITHNF